MNIWARKTLDSTVVCSADLGVCIVEETNRAGRMAALGNGGGIVVADVGTDAVVVEVADMKVLATHMNGAITIPDQRAIVVEYHGPEGGAIEVADIRSDEVVTLAVVRRLK